MSGPMILMIGTEVLNLLVFEGAREPTTYVQIFADKLYDEAFVCQPSSSTQKAAYLESAMFQSLTAQLQTSLVMEGGGANLHITAKEYVTRAIAANYQVDQTKVMDALAAFVMVVCTQGFKDTDTQTIMSGIRGNPRIYNSANLYSAPLEKSKYH